MSLSLWEGHSDLDITVNQQIEAKCVVVKEYNNRKHLESTSSVL